MKRLIFNTTTSLIVLQIIFFYSDAMAQEFFETSDQFFKSYVDERGLVDYKKLSEESEYLLTLNQIIENSDLSSMSDDQLKAFLINTYNILVIWQVVDHLPVKSPLDVNGFFDEIYHTIDGKKVSLNELEKGMIFKQFPDTRLHFLLVCAAKDCPKLANFAFMPDQLELQIAKRTKYILNDKDFIKEKEQMTEVSMIFNWYIKDFGGSNKSIARYINSYREGDAVLKSNISFYEYDWSLNSQ